MHHHSGYAKQSVGQGLCFPFGWQHMLLLGKCGWSLAEGNGDYGGVIASCGLAVKTTSTLIGPPDRETGAWICSSTWETGEHSMAVGTSKKLPA